MMKHFYSLALAAALVLSLAGCGGSASSASPAGGDAASVAASEPAASEPAAEPTGLQPQDVALEAEQVLLDDGGVKVTATDIRYGTEEYDGVQSEFYEVQLKVENHSGKTLIPFGYGGCDAEMNGRMTYMSYVCATNNPSTDLRLQDGDEVEWALRQYAEWGTDEALPLPQSWRLVLDFSEVGPEGYPNGLYVQSAPVELVTNAAAPDAGDAAMAGETLYEDENVALALGSFIHNDAEFFVQNGMEQYQLTVDCRNASDQMVYFTAILQSVNGLPAKTQSISSTCTFPGATATASLLLEKSELADLGLASHEDIETLAFTVNAYRSSADYLNGVDPLFATETFTLDKAWLQAHYTAYSSQE